MVQAHPKLFKTEGKLYPQYTRVYSRPLVKIKPLQEEEVSTLQETIAQEFDRLLQTDLPRIQEALATQAWIWAEDAPYANEGEAPEDSADVEEEQQTEQ